MFWLLACVPPPEGLRLTPSGDGPVVRVDWDAEPLPDIPFPNDLATRPDPRSPTGLRPNLPLDAPVVQEARVRATLDTLSGFGVFAPITVAFDRPLDLQTLVDRHRDDADPDSFRDDAVLVIDVDPDSPARGEVVRLDLGHGRFTSDLTNVGPVLSGDPRASDPSTLFDSTEEDVDGDGVLDPGEDTDGDEILDHPNVWPVGGDPRLDLMTFYDRASATLRVRPVVPLREQTTYAVVLTSDLVGEDGEPVRSPWEWVNHTAQTEALERVIEPLETLGRGVDDVAFAWTFTTGSVTRELWDVAQGVRGDGPFAWLADAYPAGVTEAHDLHTSLVAGPTTVLPVAAVIDPLTVLGAVYLSEGSMAVLADGYRTFGDVVVGGAIVSPDLLVDRDDGGLDDSDEHWEVDATTGLATVGPRRVVFTCVVPKAGEGVQPPWPIALHSHGYGSFRLEFFAFAYAQLRQGIAVCGIDAPGHGLGLDAEFADAIASLLDLTGTDPLWWHLLDDRQRDLDNDGVDDPAGDMFSADPFHTRDMLRQGVLDWTQLIRSLQACGTGTMQRMQPTPDGPQPTGDTLVSCDWDGDGAADLGGPDTRFLIEGVSQGGIMSAVSVAVNEADTAVLTVPGGGLADVAARTDIGGVQKAMTGRALSPVFVGQPDGRIDQVVISLDSEVSLPIADLGPLPPGGRVVVRNLSLGRESWGWIAADGRFYVPIAANALDAAEKRIAAGIPVDAIGGDEVFVLPDNVGLGDRLELELFDAAGASIAVVDTFDRDVVHEGLTMEAGSPLVAASWGLGHRRGSSDLQRIVTALAIGIEGADPIAFARRWEAEPFDQPKDVLIHLTVGDPTVPESTGIALARADGLVPFDQIDPRYGTSVDRWLIDRGVVRGLEELGPYTGPSGEPILFDPDDLDDGTDASGAPSEAPLRSERTTDSGIHALRMLYVDPRGTHAYILPDQDAPFDWALFGAQQMATFLATGQVSDDPCLATPDCSFLRPFVETP